MSLKKLLKEYKTDPDFILQGLLVDTANQLKDLMLKKGLTQKQLAERMGVKPSYITKIFSADENISLKTIAKVLAALEVDATIKIDEIPKEESKNIIDLSLLEKKDEAEDSQFVAA